MNLLEEVKAHLRIIDNEENKYIENIINNSKIYLNDLAGVDLNFQEEGLSKMLLLNHVRYAYNNASEYFEENFNKEILRLQIKSAVGV